MRCPSCFNAETKVVDSRASEDGASIRRRRECEKCGWRFSTYEEVEILNLTVIKNDGHEESYSKEKIINGLHKALEKRGIPAERFLQTTAVVERDIQLKAKNDKITSKEIGEIVMRHLKKLDKVGYIRFASVYRDFQDVETFQEELDKLSKKTKP